MQTSKNRKALTFSGVFLIAIAIGGFIWYEWGGGREMINYQDVIVLNTDVKQGDVITEELLSIQRVDKLMVIQGIITDPATLIGKEAKHFIPAATQLHNYYFEESGLVLSEGEFIAQIPVDWTLSIPDTLRRGDQIVIYAANYDQQVLENLQPKQTVVSTEKKETPNENAASIDVKSEDANATETEETTKTEEVPTTPSVSETSELTELLNTKVAFVKDGSNKEVVTISPNDRLDASSNIENVEIITTLEKFQQIENKIKQGGKLIVMYSNETAEGTKTVGE